MFSIREKTAEKPAPRDIPKRAKSCGKRGVPSTETACREYLAGRLLSERVESRRFADGGNVRRRSQEERDDRPLTLQTLAGILGIHLRTLQAATRDGRLAVTYGTRACFGRPVALVTQAAGRAFQHLYCRKTTRLGWVTANT
jgi:hypothetical protein